MTQPLPPIDACRRRHTLIYPRSRAWQVMLAEWMANAPEDRTRALLAQWATHAWPVIARREGAPGPTSVAVGVPLPPAAGKARIALRLHYADIDRVDELPVVGDLLHCCPPQWQATLVTIADLAADLEVKIRVFGSLAWQYLTGLSYVGPNSDLDLIWPVRCRNDMTALLAHLAVLEQSAPMRLDGEIEFEDGSAVHWRELAAGAQHVMVKTSRGVELREASAIWQGLPCN